MLSKITMPSGGTNTDQLSWSPGKERRAMPSNAGHSLGSGDRQSPARSGEFRQGTLLKRLVEEGSYGTVGDMIAYIVDPRRPDRSGNRSVSSQPAGTTWTSSRRLNRQRWPRQYRNGDHSFGAADSSNEVKATPAAKKKPAIAVSIWRGFIAVSGKKNLRRNDVAQFSGVSAGSPD